MDNFTKLITLKTKSKNFTSEKGRKIYNSTIELLNKIRMSENLSYQNSEEVNSFINKNNFFIKN